MDFIELELPSRNITIGYEYSDTIMSPIGQNGPVPHYEIKIVDQTTQSFDFYGSIMDARNGKDSLTPEELSSVAYCLISDAYSGMSQTAEEFQEEFGYDNYLQAVKIHTECSRTYDKLCDAFGERLSEDDLSEMTNDLIDIENGDADLKFKEVPESELTLDESDKEPVNGTEVINLNWGNLMQGEDYDNLTASVFLQGIEGNLDDLKELFEKLDDLKTCLDDKEEGWLEEVNSQLEEIKDNFEVLEKYVGPNMTGFTKLVKESIDETIDGLDNETLQESEVAEKLGTILEIKPTVESYLYNEYNGLEVDGPYPEEKIQEASDSFHPMMNTGWKLESTPTEEEVKDILENAPNVSIVGLYGQENNRYKIEDYYVTMNGAGMDFSQALAYAYLTIDNNIPAELMTEKSDRNLYTVSEAGMKKISEYFDGLNKSDILKDDSVEKMITSDTDKMTDDERSAEMGKLSGSKTAQDKDLV